MFNLLKKILKPISSAKYVSKAVIKTGELLVIPQKLSKLTYKIVVMIVTYSLVGCLIAVAVGNLTKNIWDKLKIDIKDKFPIIILSQDEKVLLTVLKKFDNAKLKTIYTVVKTTEEFIGESPKFDVGIIQGEENIKILEKNNIFFPMQHKNTIQSIVSKDAINANDLVHFEMCKVLDGKISIFTSDDNGDSEFRKNHSIIIGKLSQSVNDTHLAIFVSFLSHQCSSSFKS